jgi:hypothetical protein
MFAIFHYQVPVMDHSNNISIKKMTSSICLSLSLSLCVFVSLVWVGQIWSAEMSLC